MGGYIGLHRCLLDKPIWKQSTPQQKVILVTLLLMANYKEAQWEWKGEKFKVKPGQFITSLDKIVEKTGKGVSIKNVRSALERFEKLDFLANESTKTGRLITIVNWELYQVEKDIVGKDTGKEVANNRQRGGKEVAPNNKDNKNKKDNKNIKIFTSDSAEYRLSLYLSNWIKKNNPGAKAPNLQNWSKTFDYILRIDGRDLEEVKKLIKWCQEDSFWLKNILSPTSFREKYERFQVSIKNLGKGKTETKGNFNNYEQRTYDFDQLEKNLLGWDDKKADE